MTSSSYSLLAIIALPLLFGCGSPLDAGTDRIDTRITNGIKLRELSVGASIFHGSDTIIIEDWAYTVTSSLFKADTAADPPRLRMERVMQGTHPENNGIWLKKLEIRLDSVSTQGTLTLNGASGPDGQVRATVVIDGVEYTSSAGDAASTTLHYRYTGKRTVQGTIAIGLDRSPGFSLLVAVNFMASQD